MRRWAPALLVALSAGPAWAQTPAPAAPPNAAQGVRTSKPNAVELGRQARREQARERAFETTEDALAPMTPEQLQSLIQSLETTEAISSSHHPPEQAMTTEALDLNAPRPPVLRVGEGFGSSVVFVDRTGKIWPITAQQGFNKNLIAVEASTVTGDKSDLPTVLTVQAKASAGASNLIVILKDLETPVVISLVLGQKTIDSRKAYKLPFPGPNASPEYHPSSPNGVGSDILNVLNGLPPVASATRVQISGGDPDAMAWRAGDHLYLRTVAEVYSPEPIDQSRHPSGLRAYKLSDVPVHLVSFNGNMIEITTKE